MLRVLHACEETIKHDSGFSTTVQLKCNNASLRNAELRHFLYGSQLGSHQLTRWTF